MVVKTDAISEWRKAIQIITDMRDCEEDQEIPEIKDEDKQDDNQQ